MSGQCQIDDLRRAATDKLSELVNINREACAAGLLRAGLSEMNITQSGVVRVCEECGYSVGFMQWADSVWRCQACNAEKDFP